MGVWRILRSSRCQPPRHLVDELDSRGLAASVEDREHADSASWVVLLRFSRKRILFPHRSREKAMRTSSSLIVQATICGLLLAFGTNSAEAECVGGNTCYGDGALPENTGTWNSAFGFQA